MKQILILIGVIILLGGVSLYINYVRTHEEPVPPVTDGEAMATETLADPEHGFSLQYPVQYTLLIPADVPEGNQVFFRSLVDTAAYEENTTPTEGPAAIVIEVFRNPQNLEIAEWIRTMSESQFERALEDEIGSARIGEYTYATYRYDGLYAMQAYAIERSGYVYLFSAALADEVGTLDTDLRRMLETIDWSEPTVPAQTTHGDIRVSTPELNGTISSPLLVTGEARGPWFFEATFPLVLVDWDGRIIAEGYATAEDDWMTESFIPFSGTLEFETPEFNERGTLILQKANASGLPEHDDAIEIPVQFE